MATTNGIDDEALFIETYGPVLTTSGVPQHLWPALHRKLNAECFDAGDSFVMMEGQGESGESGKNWQVLALEDIPCMSPEAIFLVDHAWTFRPQRARDYLEQVDGLAQRMATLMDIEQLGSGREEMGESSVEEEQQQNGVEHEPPPLEEGGEHVQESMSHSAVELHDTILRRIWRYAQTYTVASETDPERRQPIWYIMDEFGSRIQHSMQPNARIVPFFYPAKQCAFSLLFPIADIQAQTPLTRNYIEGMAAQQPGLEDVYMVPWQPEGCDRSAQSFDYIPATDDFYREFRVVESLPASANDLEAMDTTGASGAAGERERKVLKVYSEYPSIEDFLDDARFEFTPDLQEADVLWLRRHFTNYARLSMDQPGSMVSQFPCENVLTVKDLFAATVHLKFGSCFNPQTLTSAPSWYPVTYNLNTELAQFVAHYQKRQALGLDNHWIVKPWNLARSLDMHVTDDLAAVVRLTEGGPKLACKYVERPVLFKRDDLAGNPLVKFDLRFIVLLKSVRPLRAYVYDKFWIRFANQAFNLTQFDVYEKHFTVMNYSAKSSLKNLKCEEFSAEFETQYPSQSWNAIEKQCREVMKAALEVATTYEPPKGIASNAQSRALYGMDVMLRWAEDDRIEPVFLEANFMPDCTRASAFYPAFINQVFEALFLDTDCSQLPISAL